MTKVAIVGGGAAGFFLAINLKEMQPAADVTIYERGSKVLRKVAVSGGGRCNCTNTFAGVKDLSSVYPRGHRLMRRLSNVFDHKDAYKWFESHGVELTVQADGCVFPAAQDSQAITDCFVSSCHRLGITIKKGQSITSMSQLSGYDTVCVTTGGSPTGKGLAWLRELGHEIEDPVPSLYSLSVEDKSLRSLMGIVAAEAVVGLPGTKIRTQGALLITHWGLSGPAILKMSSHAARLLHDCGYKTGIIVNWTGKSEDNVRAEIISIANRHQHRQVANTPPAGLTQRLWEYLAEKATYDKSKRWCDLSKKDINRLIATACGDTISVTGRAPFKDEFVTCGGVSLRSIDPTSMESRVVPGLYFAGEVLDIDGVTGGFNFQAAWTTAYVAAQSISRKIQLK